MASCECVREIADELDGTYRVPDTTGEAIAKSSRSSSRRMPSPIKR